MRSKPITHRDDPRLGRVVNASPDRDYDGPNPTWRCPHCGKTNRRATLADVRPADVEDKCPNCGAAANDDYAEATK